MYPFDIISKRKHKHAQKKVNQPEYLLLSSEPKLSSIVAGHAVDMYYRNRYLAKRRVMRTIRRMKHEHSL